MKEDASPIEEGSSGITIVLADDHPVVRSGLRMLLENETDIEVVAEAGDVEAAQRYVLGHKPTVLVLDLNMPGGSSLDAIPDVADASPEHLRGGAHHAGGPGVRARGAAGGRARLRTQAVRRDRARPGHPRRRHRRHLAQPRARRAHRPAQTPTGPPGDLTERELDVLRLIALGHTNNEIAEQLYLSVRTVETHRAHIQQKLGLSTRAELVRYALDNDLIDR